MTPEEIKVIRRAYKSHRGCVPETCGGSRLDPCSLGHALDALTYACPDCNAGGHTCPGDGNPIPHGAGDCGEHDEPITDEQRSLARYLSEYALDVVHEWMRIVEIDGDPTEPRSGQIQARATWHGGGRFVLGRSPYSEDLGTYQLTTRVEPVYVPPVGPENDPAMIEEMKSEPTWTDTTWLHVLPGDLIRLPGKTQEATVSTLHVGDWQADVKSRLMESGKWWDSVEAWDHQMIGVRLEHMPERLLTFRTDAPVEILMNGERTAIHHLQVGFPGSTVDR
jgi:hypothetical protein